MPSGTTWTSVIQAGYGGDLIYQKQIGAGSERAVCSWENDDGYNRSIYVQDQSGKIAPGVLYIRNAVLRYK